MYIYIIYTFVYAKQICVYYFLLLFCHREHNKYFPNSVCTNIYACLHTFVYMQITCNSSSLLQAEGLVCDLVMAFLLEFDFWVKAKFRYGGLREFTRREKPLKPAMV